MTKLHLLAGILCSIAGFGSLQAVEAAASPALQCSKQNTASLHPFFQTGFYPSWSQMTAAKGKEDVLAGIEISRKRIADICRLKPEEMTYENVFGAIENMQDELEQTQNYMYHLSSVMDNAGLRTVQEELIPTLSAFSAEISGNDQLWQAVKTAAAQEWVKSLSPAKQRYVKQVVDSFRESGADLPASDKERKTAIELELSQLLLKFGKNVLDSTKAWKLVITDRNQLAGMTEKWMHKAAADALAEGYGTEEEPQWLITLDHTSVGDVMRDCSVEATRKACWEGQCSIGKVEPYDNEPIVARVMELRRELAELLGFKDYADLKCAHRMVDKGEKALAFVDGMIAKVQPAFEAECKELLDFVSDAEGQKVDKLKPWNRSFYMNLLSRKKYNFDPENLRPYLESGNVLKGMFSIFSHLYDISISSVPGVCLQPGETCPGGKAEVWHKDVQIFKVTDNKTGKHLGSFYYDPYPRAGKRAGAWVMPLRPGKRDVKGMEPHLATLVGNLTAPVKDGPTLYSPYDVETVFHEFGHMMHCMLSDTELRAHACTGVAWDFVELPSQLNENWTWEPEGIATYAFHYQTGEPIPADLLKRYISSRFFMPAMDNMAQLSLAKLDLEIHMHYANAFAGKPLDDATNALLASMRIPVTQNPPSIMRHLTHCITGGYAAGYFCYKWAEVLAADAFSRFADEGVMNAATGASYRENILSKGDSKPAGELYRNFMGHEPNPDALLRKQGLMK